MPPCHWIYWTSFRENPRGPLILQTYHILLTFYEYLLNEPDELYGSQRGELTGVIFRHGIEYLYKGVHVLSIEYVIKYFLISCRSCKAWYCVSCCLELIRELTSFTHFLTRSGYLPVIWRLASIAAIATDQLLSTML